MLLKLRFKLAIFFLLLLNLIVSLLNCLVFLRNLFVHSINLLLAILDFFLYFFYVLFHLLLKEFSLPLQSFCQYRVILLVKAFNLFIEVVYRVNSDLLFVAHLLLFSTAKLDKLPINLILYKPIDIVFLTKVPHLFSLNFHCIHMQRLLIVWKGMPFLYLLKCFSLVQPSLQVEAADMTTD